MYAVEFKARVRDGSIAVPRKYRNILTDTVKVIVMKENIPDQTASAPGLTAIDRLLDDPLRLAEFQPFTRDEVYER